MRFLGKSKAIIASVLTLGMVFSTVSPVRAAEQDNNYNLKVLEDTDKIKVVETSDEENIYVSTYDKENNTIKIAITDIETNVMESSVEVAVTVVDYEPERKTRAVSSGEKTFTNYEYSIKFGTPNVWTIRRPDGLIETKYFKIKVTKKNKADLDKYRDIVKQINSIEGDIGVKIVLAVLADMVGGAAGAVAIFTGGAMTPAALGALSAVAGANGLAIATVEKWSSLCKSAYEQYYTIFYAYDIL